MGSLATIGVWITKGIAAVASFNYQLVTSIFKAIESCSKVAITVCTILGAALSDLLQYLGVILIQFGSFVYCCLESFFYVISYIFTVCLYSIILVGEAIASLAGCIKVVLLYMGKFGAYCVSLWNSARVTFTEEAPMYVDALSQNRFSQSASSGIQRGTKYVAATIGAIIGSTYDNLSGAAKDYFACLTEWVIQFTDISIYVITQFVLKIKSVFEYMAMSFQKNVNMDCYTVLFLATTVFITVKVVLDYMNKRDLTLPIPGLRRDTRIRLRHNRDVHFYVIDSSDEEIFEEDDFNEEEDTEDSEEVSVTSDDDDDDNIDDSGSVTHEEYEVASEEDSDDSLESEGGTSVEIQLPPLGTYNLRTRKKSPSPNHLGGASVPNIGAEEELNRKCVVCQDQPKTVLVLPCKHMCLCVDCAHTIASLRNRVRRVCPLCRGQIQTVMNVFV